MSPQPECSCGVQLDAYRERLATLLRENKRLNADLRAQQAEVLLLRGLLKAAGHNTSLGTGGATSPSVYIRDSRGLDPPTSCMASPISYSEPPPNNRSSHQAPHSVEHSICATDSLLWEIDQTLSDSGGRRCREASSSVLRGGRGVERLGSSTGDPLLDLAASLGHGSSSRGAQVRSSVERRSPPRLAGRHSAARGADEVRSYGGGGAAGLRSPLSRDASASSSRFMHATSKVASRSSVTDGRAGYHAMASGQQRTGSARTSRIAGTSTGREEAKLSVRRSSVGTAAVKHSSKVVDVASGVVKRGKAAVTGARAARRAEELQEADGQLDELKASLFVELKRRLPTEKAIEFLSYMQRLAESSISYEDAWSEVHGILGPLNMDLFHAFTKIMYGYSGAAS